MIKDGEEASPQSACVGTPKTILEKILLSERPLSDIRQRSRSSSSTGLRAFGNNQKRPERITVREPSAESASSVTSFLAVGAD